MDTDSCTSRRQEIEYLFVDTESLSDAFADNLPSICDVRSIKDESDVLADIQPFICDVWSINEESDALAETLPSICDVRSIKDESDGLAENLPSICDVRSINEEDDEVAENLPSISDVRSIKEENDAFADRLLICDVRSVKREVVGDALPASGLSGSLKQEPGVHKGVDATEDASDARTENLPSICDVRSIKDEVPIARGHTPHTTSTTDQAAPIPFEPGSTCLKNNNATPDKTGPVCAAGRGSGGESEERLCRGAGPARDAAVRPPFTFAELSAMAIAQSPHRKVILTDIYTYIENRFPYFKRRKRLWKNSIRVSLSVNKCFVKEGRCGRGSYWTLDPKYEGRFGAAIFSEYRHLKRTTRGAPEELAGTGDVRRLLDDRHHERQMAATSSLPSQLPSDGNVRSTVTPTSSSLFASTSDTTGQVAPDSSHPGGDCCEDDHRPSEAEMSADGVGTLTTTSIGNGNDCTVGSHVNRAGDVRPETKPPLSYVELIAMAIVESSNRRATLTEIRAYIVTHFPYYKHVEESLKNAIHSTMYFSKYFIRVPQDGSSHKGKHNSCWTLDPKYEDEFRDGKFAHRRIVKEPLCKAAGETTAHPERRRRAGLLPRPQLQGGVREHDTTTPVATPLSNSKIGSTGRTASDSPRRGSTCYEVDTSVSDRTTSTGIGSTPTAGTEQCRSEAGADKRPPYTNIQLIVAALAHSPHRRATLSEIYAYISSRFSYFRQTKKLSVHRISCTLSATKCFVKVPWEESNRKGNYWMLDPQYEGTLETANLGQHQQQDEKRTASGVPVIGTAQQQQHRTASPTSRRNGGVTGSCDRDDDRCENNSLESGTEMSAATLTSQSGGAGSPTSNDRAGAAVGTGAGDGSAKLKPPLSYDELIALAIMESPCRRATSSKIITYIATRFPYFERSNKSWQRSVACRLSLGEYFVRAPLPGDSLEGKSCNYWTLAPNYKQIFENGKFHRHRRSKRPTCSAVGKGTVVEVLSGTTHQQHRAEQPQLPGAVDGHSSATTPISTGPSVSEAGSTRRAAPGWSPPGSSHCESDSPAPDTSTSTGDAGATLSTSGDTDNNLNAVPDVKIEATNSAVGDEERCLGGSRSVSTRPLLSYKSLIAMAILQSPHRRATLSEICVYIIRRFPYFKMKRKKVLAHLISSTLSCSKCFTKVPWEGSSRQGNYWMLDPQYEDTYKNGNLRRHWLWKRPVGGVLRGDSTADCPRDALWHRLQHRTGLSARAQLPAAADRAPAEPPSAHTAATAGEPGVGSDGYGRCDDSTTPTSMSLSVSKVGSSGQVTQNLSETDGSYCEGDTSVKDVTGSERDGAPATTTSASGGAANGVAVGDEGTATGSASEEVGEENRTGDGGSACSADTKPPFSYTQLCAMAIAHSPHRKATFSDILTYIVRHFPYYKQNSGWQKSLQNNLSRNKSFINVQQKGAKQRASYWILDRQYDNTTKRGDLHRHWHAKWLLRRPLREVNGPRVSSDVDSAHHLRGAQLHPRRQRDTGQSVLSRPQSAAGRLSSESSDRWAAAVAGRPAVSGGGGAAVSPFEHRNCTATPSSPGIFTSQFDSTDEAAPDSSHPAKRRCEDDIRASDTATVTDGAVGNGSCLASGTDREVAEAGEGPGKEQASSNSGLASTGRTKSRFCYEELIAMAILDSPRRRATMSEIYAYISSRFRYLRRYKSNWQKSVCCTLASSKYFIKVPLEGSKCSNYWMLDPNLEDTFENGNFRRHRRTKRAFRSTLRVATVPEVPPGTVSTRHGRDVRHDRRHCRAGLRHRPQLPGAVDTRKSSEEC